MTAVTGALCDSWLWTSCGAPPTACFCPVRRGNAERDVAARPGCRCARTVPNTTLPHCFPTREALCSSPDVDVVFITSPDAMHRDDTLLALQHGKAVLCEKPLAMNAAEAEEMNSCRQGAGDSVWRGAELSFQPKPGVDAGADRRGAHRKAATCACAVLLSGSAGARESGSPIQRWLAVGRSQMLACIASMRFVLCWARR